MSSIARHIGEKRTTVQSWKTRDKRDAASPLERVETALDARLCMLIAKDQKDGRDFKEIDLLGRQLAHTARVRKFDSDG